RLRALVHLSAPLRRAQASPSHRPAAAGLTMSSSCQMHGELTLPRDSALEDSPGDLMQGRISVFTASDIQAPATLSLIEAMGAAVVLLDPQGRARATSPAMRALIPSLSIGQPLSLVMRDPDLVEAIAKVTARGGREV